MNESVIDPMIVLKLSKYFRFMLYLPATGGGIVHIECTGECEGDNPEILRKSTTMAFRIRRVTYYYTLVRDQPGESYNFLSQLAALGINHMAFTAIPIGPDKTQLTIFPDDDGKFQQATYQVGLTMDGPHQAFLVQGDDDLGALSAVHEKIFRAGVNVFASSGVSDGKGMFGYVIYVRPESFDRAAEALGV